MDRYEQYKDSGIQWIGDIPIHWGVMRLKTCCYLKGRIGWNGLKSEEFESSSYAYLVTGQDFNSSVIQWDNCYQINQRRYEEDVNIQLTNGDLLVTKDGTIGKVAKVSNLDKPACLNSGIFLIRRKKDYFIQGYLYWSLLSSILVEYNRYTQTGATIAHLYQNVFEQMPCLIPPKDEQEAIATYLDSEVSKIDKAIKQQQKMIELLNERRQIIISEAVTKGVNPDVQMKDSGIDWMGAIPAHWEIISLKRACTIKTGKTPSSNSTKYWDGGKVNWFTPGDFKDFKLTDSERKVTRTAIRENACFEYPACSVYLIGIGGTIGKIAYSEYPASCNQQINVLIPKCNVHYKYIAYVMTICRPEVMRNANMSTLPIINQEKTGGIMITLPPFLEQKAISQQIEVKCASIQEKINQANTEIALLTERKRIIINEAVTGKVKVS